MKIRKFYLSTAKVYKWDFLKVVILMNSTKGTFNSLILRAPICKINSQNVKRNKNFFHSSITHSTNTYFKLFMIEEIHSFFLRKHWYNEKKFLKKQSNSFFSNVESLKSYSWSKFYFSKVFQVKEAWFFVTSHFVTYSVSLHIQSEMSGKCRPE